MRIVILISLFGLAAFGAAATDDRVKFDNDAVRVLKVTDIPHKASALHKHDLNRVMIYLTAGDLDVTAENGKVEHQHWKAEQVAWSPAGGMHTSENVGTKPLVIVEVELKRKSPPAPKRDPKLDPVAIDAKHDNLIFENSQVRVFRSWREPGMSEMMHEHTGAGRVVVLLTDIDAKVKSANGEASGLQDKAGEVHWTAGSSTHAGTNAGAKRFDMILVEVK
jgi:oxalate decarboxylase/phosphoglucose isomerase-like protein (cupin superfamily)